MGTLRYVGPQSAANTASSEEIVPRLYTERMGSWGSGPVRVQRPVRAFGLDTAHSSAPSVCMSKSGRLYMLYRQGTDHYVSRDGVLKLTYSDDGGRTWSALTTVLNMTPTWDSQGQGISESRDGTKLYMVYFKASASNGAAGVFFKTSTDQGATWSAETRVDALGVAATTDVIIEQADGSLLLAFYGRASTSDAYDSVYTARSTNGGTTWTVTQRKNGITDSRHYQEPVLAVSGATAVMTFRWGNTQSIGTMVSTDYGLTWSTPTERFPGTGKPHSFWANEKTVACIYRELSTGHAKIRTTRDNGTTWTPARMVHPTYYPSGWMLYSSSTPITPYQHIVAFAEERTAPDVTPGTSRIFLTGATEAGGVTPFGVVHNETQNTAERLEEIQFATRFEQTDGAPDEPWSAVVHNGASATPNVADGQLSPGSLSVNTLARVYVNQLNDIEAEADIYTATGSGSSIGLVFRMVSAGTYLLAASEDANFRLYGYSGGSLIGGTFLASAANVHPYDRWNKFKVIARGARIYCYFNDVLIINFGLAAGDQTTFSTGYYHGVKLNSQAGAANNHKCRRFVVRA
jgi:hypothetical protein